MLLHPNYANRIKDILVKDYGVNAKAFICKGYNIEQHKKEKEEDSNNNEPINKIFNLKEEEGQKNNNNIPNNNTINSSNNQNNSSKKQKVLDEFLGKKRKEENSDLKIEVLVPPHLQVEEIKNETHYDIQKLDIKLPNDLILNTSNCLNFELFCLKWERIVLLEGDSIVELSKFTSIISLLSLISKTKMNIQSHFPFGSYASKTMRSSNKEVDFLIEFGGEINDQTYQDFISNSFHEVSANGFKMDFFNGQGVEPFIKIENKTGDICKIYFSDKEKAKIIKEHLNFINSTKFSLEQEIAVKFLKEWRRCKQILFFPPEIIEFIVMQIGYERIHEIVFAFLDFLINELDEKHFEVPYQKEKIKELKKSENFPKILQEAKNAVENIKSSKYEELF